ncbi:MAG: hypothetical protein ACR2M3_11140 [Thermomicrobiales bacterium]
MLEQRNIGAVDSAEALALVAEDIQQLQEFARLEADWNSYGAKPTAQTAITVATDLLKQVARIARVRPDFVAPLANGGVQLEWADGAAEIAIRVYPNQTLAYLRTEGNRHTEKDDVPLSEVVNLVAQTLSR